MMGYLLDGGWMMLPLLLCSIGLLAVVIDRARAFRAAAIDHEALRKQVNAAVNSGEIDRAIAVCEASTGPVAATLLAGLLRLKRLRARQKSAAEIEITVSKTMEDYAPKAMHGLERRLREGLDRGERIQEAVIVADNAINLRLLKHDLRYPDAVGVVGVPPGQVALVRTEPVQEKCAELADGCMLGHGEI